MKRLYLLLSLVILAPMSLLGQTQTSLKEIIPNDIYYLMPSFGKGVVYLRGKYPAEGKLNICALDNTLRFIDDDGKELEASGLEDVMKVVIDTVWFMRADDVFYRMYPVTPDIGVAQERKIVVIRGAKKGAYGDVSQTSSIREFGSYNSHGYTYDLQSGLEVPYKVETYIRVYHFDVVYPLNKKTLRKLFPEKKAQIDAWLKVNHKFPDTVDSARDLLRFFSDN